MKKAILCLLVLFNSITVFGQHAYKLVLNGLATITLPDTPKSTPTKVGNVYTVVDSGRIYLAEASVIRKGLVGLFSPHFNDDIYTGVIRGSLNNSEGKLIYKRKVKANGLNGIEFCYSAKIKSVTYYRYHQAFYADNTLVFYGLWSPDSLLNNDTKLRSFFATFKLTGNHGSSSALTAGYIVGKALGVILIIGFVVLLGLGVVYIIKKMTYK